MKKPEESQKNRRKYSRKVQSIVLYGIDKSRGSRSLENRSFTPIKVKTEQSKNNRKTHEMMLRISSVIKVVNESYFSLRCVSRHFGDIVGA